MARIEKFKDIESWKKARSLTKQIYTATSAGGFACDFSLKDQVRRASIAVLSNIAEGFERGGPGILTIPGSCKRFLRRSTSAAIRCPGSRISVT